MKKIKDMKKGACLLLSLITIFASACVGGGTTSSSDSFDSNVDSSDVPVQSTQIEKATPLGIHDFSYTETDKYLVKDGKTDYVLVYPAERDPKGLYNVARSEFLTFFKEATGISLKSMPDTNLSYTADAKYISIGDTKLLQDAGITVDVDLLGQDGVRIETKGNSLFLYGGSPYAAIYAVYDFLELEFNYDFYYTDCWEIDRGVQNVKLRNYNVTDTPDVPLRGKMYGWQYNGDEGDKLYDQYRYRLCITENMISLPIYSKYDTSSTSARSHNTSEMFPKSVYMDEHPKWFSTDTIQPCFTARGDEAELELMVQEAAKKIQFSLMSITPKSAPEMNTVQISVEDGAYHCACEVCMETAEKYGGHESAAVIMFVNRVSEKVDAWMELEENADYKRDLTYIFFANNYYQTAPVFWDNATQSYQPLAPELEMRENVGVYLCVKGVHRESMYDDKNYQGCYEETLQWAALTDKMYMWYYSTNFGTYIGPSDTFGYMNEDTYSFISSLGCEYLFNNTQYGQEGGATAFHLLKAYIDYKLAWNSTLKSVDLADKFFDAVYKDASNYMRTFLDEMRMHWVEVCSTNIVSNGLVIRSEYWPFATLMQWSDLCDKATAAIEKYKETDLDLYKRTLKYINIERVMLDYYLLELYPTYFTESELSVIQKRLKETVLEAGISQSSEGKSNMYEYVKNF